MRSDFFSFFLPLLLLRPLDSKGPGGDFTDSLRYGLVALIVRLKKRKEKETRSQYMFAHKLLINIAACAGFSCKQTLRRANSLLSMMYAQAKSGA